ncbi:hypothetical protein Tco_0958290 [Tanacetum coccineum]
MWTFLISTIHAWRDQEGAPSTFEIGESSITHVLLLTERIETLEQEVKTLRDRAEIGKQGNEDLHAALGRARHEIIEHQICHEGLEARLRQCKDDMLELRPHYFKGIEGVVEKIESVFQISNCAESFQVKFAACTLLDGALTWWNSYVKTIELDAAMTTWKEIVNHKDS